MSLIASKARLLFFTMRCQIDSVPWIKVASKSSFHKRISERWIWINLSRARVMIAMALLQNARCLKSSCPSICKDWSAQSKDQQNQILWYFVMATSLSGPQVLSPGSSKPLVLWLSDLSSIVPSFSRTVMGKSLKVSSPCWPKEIKWLQPHTQCMPENWKLKQTPVGPRQ